MRLRTRTWAAISLLCFLGAAWFWRLGEQQRLRRSPAPADTNTLATPAGPPKELGKNLNDNRTRPLPAAPKPAAPANQVPSATTTRTNRLLAYRLANTGKSLEQLMRSEQAVLLRNALIDTGSDVPLNVPAHLKAKGDPGAYVVQARGPLDDAFRRQLRAAGATIVSYIPNNAYLVQTSEAGAAQLRAWPQTQTVLAWEPYFKLDLQLLELALKQEAMTEPRLSVLFYPGDREAGLAALDQLGAKVVGEDRSVFGHQVVVEVPVQAPANSPSPPATGHSFLTALAQSPLVQLIEPHRARRPANDLSRVRVGVTSDTITTTNYLNLDGDGVLVSVNDTGVYANHPALSGRVTGDSPTATLDMDGHGTHVAGTLAGDGLGTITSLPPGSATNANFRGMAPRARLYVSEIDLITGPLISDSHLQETPARTNALISNNSWGYVGLAEYNLSAASFDAAVRDALPRDSGSQPVLFVFSAGNDGAGNSDGLSGVPDTIGTPATAKNVITVGAIEQLRMITNQVADATGQTNQAFLIDTDSNDEVASFSSRGNVGVGLEGTSGRFKPDLVAPGTFVVSCRSPTWTDPSGFAGAIVNRLNNQFIAPGGTNLGQVFVPANGVTLGIRTLPNASSPNPFPALPIWINKDTPPNVGGPANGFGQAFVPVDSGNWFYAIGNTNSGAVSYDLQTIIIVANTNFGDYFSELKRLNDDLLPDYRFESGTSQAAPAVSGTLALMQQFFGDRLGRVNSPALMKALLINGARSAGTTYSLQVQNAINYQGWGLISISNSIPPALDGFPGQPELWPMVFFEQSPANALATDQRHVRQVQLRPAAQIYPLRVTLVWTDPPGNPGASLKLVNDLDLVVSNRVTGEYYVGNNIPQGSDFNDITDTNVVPVFDVVNNVENVFINGPLDNDYDVIVRARRVNVNAVTEHPNGVVQDYALVISSGNSRLTNAFSVVPALDSVPPLVELPTVYVTNVTDRMPLLRERVGANNPLDPVPNNGRTNQWNFYVYTNTTVFTNVAIVTFLTPNLARSRFVQADVDLYVSPNPGLINLDAAVVADCILGTGGSRASRRRGGSELVVFTNVGPGSVFHIGVKAEDQQAAEFGLVAFASNELGGRDANGNVPLTFFPIEIPDGSPERPEAGVTLAVAADPGMARRVIVTTTLSHTRGGDLLGNLEHDGQFAVLNNKRSFDGFQTWTYDDSGEGGIPNSQVTDGPGTLRNFEGQPIFGVWTLQMIDNAPNHVGAVVQASGYIEPQEELTGEDGLFLTAAPNQWRYVSVNTPAGATNMIVFVTQHSVPSTLDTYIRRGARPDVNAFDKFASIAGPPGGFMTYGIYDRPPLQPGQYFIGVSNGTTATVTYNLRVEFEYDLTPIGLRTYASTNTPLPLLDDALISSVITVTNPGVIGDVEVGVRLDHPRASDLVLHLTSPQGTRLLLAENRGALAATNFGIGPLNSNFTYVTFVENENVGSPMKFALPPFSTPPTNQVLFTNGFEFQPAMTYAQTDFLLGDSFNDVWEVLTNHVAIITDTNRAHTGTNYLALSDGRLSVPLPIVPDRDYLLTFAYRKVSSSPTQSVDVAVDSTANIFQRFNPPVRSPASGDPVAVPKLRVCPGQELMIQADTNCIPTGAACTFAAGDTNTLFQGLPIYSLIGCWSRSPKVLDSNTVAGAPFYIGANTLFTAPTPPGDYYLFLGINDDNHDDNLGGQLAVRLEWQQCQYASAEYVLGNTTNTVVGEFYWQTNTLLFTANPTITDLILQPGLNFTMLFDTFELLFPIVSVNYLAEESLNPFKNQQALGDWRLDLWDNRAGPAVPDAGILQSWTLNFTFGRGAAAIALTNDIPYFDEVRGDEIRYFQVNVPREVTAATNLLLAPAGVQLLYSPFGLPTGTVPPDPVGAIPPGFDFVVTPASPAGAGLVPGGRYFLGVRNLNPAATNNFAISVTFDVPIVQLTNGLPLLSQIAVFTNRVEAETNTALAVRQMQYFRFDVPNSNNLSMRFDLTPRNPALRDVNMVLKRARPVVDLFPRPTSFEYESTACDADPELILVNTNSLPVSLAPGVWYLGVYNVSTNPVEYELEARRSSNAVIYSVIDLTNAVPQSFTASAPLEIFYRFVVDGTNDGVLFEIYDLTGDADLIVKRADLPAPDLYDFSFLMQGNLWEPVGLRTNIFIPHLNATNWFLGIVPRVPGGVVAGTVCASVAANGLLVSCMPLMIMPAGGVGPGFEISWTSVPGERYELQTSTDMVNWVTLVTLTATGTTTTYTDPTPIGTLPMLFYRVGQVP